MTKPASTGATHAPRIHAVHILSHGAKGEAHTFQTRRGEGTTFSKDTVFIKRPLHVGDTLGDSCACTLKQRVHRHELDPGWSPHSRAKGLLREAVTLPSRGLSPKQYAVILDFMAVHLSK